MSTVLVTGASKGIGREIALKFALQGHDIVVNYNSSESEAFEVAKQIEKMGRRYLLCKADVSDQKQVDEMFNAASKTFGGVDILVNNAGVSLTKLIQDTSSDEIARVIGVNTIGVINCCKAAAPYMISSKCGRIINISSIWGKVGASMESVYSASKGAVIAFSLALAKELAPSGVLVNCICPGVIDTDMLKNLTAEDKKDLQNQTPINRLGSAEDVANMACFLAGKDAEFVTGQVVCVDGGFIL